VSHAPDDWSKRTEQIVTDALRRQRDDLATELESRREAEEERERQRRHDAVKHWTGLVGFVLATLGAVGAGVSWYTGKVVAEAREDVRREQTDERLRALEKQLAACTGGQ
jgi:hypothetical protein